jgi:hypothetical protein
MKGLAETHRKYMLQAGLDPETDDYEFERNGSIFKAMIPREGEATENFRERVVSELRRRRMVQHEVRSFTLQTP